MAFKYQISPEARKSMFTAEKDVKPQDMAAWLRRRPGYNPEPAPTMGQAITNTTGQLDADMRKRRQSQTLFTSGQGVLDSPLIASALLLGS